MFVMKEGQNNIVVYKNVGISKACLMFIATSILIFFSKASLNKFKS